MYSESDGWLWLVIGIGLFFGLGGALAYGSLKWREWKQHPEKARERDRATRKAYRRD